MIKQTTLENCYIVFDPVSGQALSTDKFHWFTDNPDNWQIYVTEAAAKIAKTVCYNALTQHYNDCVDYDVEPSPETLENYKRIQTVEVRAMKKFTVYEF